MREIEPFCRVTVAISFSLYACSCAIVSGFLLAVASTFGVICSSMLDLGSNRPSVGGMPPFLREVEPFFRVTTAIVEDEAYAHHWREAASVVVLAWILQKAVGGGLKIS